MSELKPSNVINSIKTIEKDCEKTDKKHSFNYKIFYNWF